MALGNLDSSAKHVIKHTGTVLVTWTTSTAELVSFILFPFSLQLPPTLDLRVIGQSTRVERSTIEQVRTRIALMREKTKDAVTAKTYDFDKRLAEIKAKEAAIREERKMQKKLEKEKARLQLVQETAQDDDMAKMMGFGGFGSSKK